MSAEAPARLTWDLGEEVRRVRESEVRAVYLRFGDVPDGERSITYLKAPTHEIGVSCYEAYEVAGYVLVPFRGSKLNFFGRLYYPIFRSSGRPAHICDGTLVGRGTVGEPLIRDVRIRWTVRATEGRLIPTKESIRGAPDVRRVVIAVLQQRLSPRPPQTQPSRALSESVERTSTPQPVLRKRTNTFVDGLLDTAEGFERKAGELEGLAGRIQKAKQVKGA